MPTQKYIGARYMPKFMGTYDATTIYEALSVVDNGSGTSYVANKPVPEGIPLSDTEYWSVYGATSGAILDLQARMSQAETDISNLETNINTLKIAIIGDSYTTNNGGGVTITPYPEILQGYLGLTDDQFKVEAQNGAGFANGLFLTLLNALANDSNLDELYVFGGWNDVSSRYTDTEVHTAMSAFTERAREKFPNAKLYLGILGYAYHMTDAEVGYFKTLDRYTYGQATRYGFDGYLDTIGICANSDSQMWADPNTGQGSHHPSTTLATYMAIYLANVIRTKTNKMLYSFTTEFETDDDSGFTAADGDVVFTNDGRHFSMINTANLVLNAKDSSTGARIRTQYEGLGWTLCGKIKKCMFSGITSAVQKIGGSIRYKTVAGGNTWHENTIRIKYEDKKVYIMLTGGSSVTDCTTAVIHFEGLLTDTYLFNV